MSPREQARLLESLTPGGFTNEIRAPHIDFHVAQVLQFVTDGSLGTLDLQEPDSDGLAGKDSWTHFHALSWYSWRFRPMSYLEIGGDPGASMAMVALSSPETNLVSCVSDREKSLRRPHFRLVPFVRELARSGSSQPLTLVPGDSLAHEAPYFTDWALRSRGRDQPHVREFELIFVDGSCRQAGIYRDLKNAFARCALGGMVVFRAMNRPEALPGQYCPRLSGYWERLPLRFPGFRFIKAPQGREIGLAYRVA